MSLYYCPRWYRGVDLNEGETLLDLYDRNECSFMADQEVAIDSSGDAYDSYGLSNERCTEHNIELYSTGDLYDALLNNMNPGWHICEEDHGSLADTPIFPSLEALQDHMVDEHGTETNTEAPRATPWEPIIGARVRISPTFHGEGGAPAHTAEWSGTISRIQGPMERGNRHAYRVDFPNGEQWWYDDPYLLPHNGTDVPATLQVGDRVRIIGPLRPGDGDAPADTLGAMGTIWHVSPASTWAYNVDLDIHGRWSYQRYQVERADTRAAVATTHSAWSAA